MSVRNGLLRMLPRRGVGAEIGVWKGDFAAQLFTATVPQHLHLIDPWKYEPAPEYTRAWYGGSAATTQDDMDRVYRSVVRRFRGWIERGVVSVHRQSSLDAHVDFAEHSLDWVYIDGNHLYEFVKQDLENFGTKVKAGGYLCGDDYGVVGWWENGVQKAVDEFAETPLYEFIAAENGQFVLRKLA